MGDYEFGFLTLYYMVDLAFGYMTLIHNHFSFPLLTVSELLEMKKKRGIIAESARKSKFILSYTARFSTFPVLGE